MAPEEVADEIEAWLTDQNPALATNQSPPSTKETPIP